MGFLDRLLGRPSSSPQPPAASRRPVNEDEAAIERYRYLLKTAPPDRIEAAHREAFATLTPEQRQQVLQRLASEVPPGERAASDDPQSLARMATRAEMRRPGTLERSFGGGGVGLGGVIAGSLLASVAGAFVGTAIADAMFDMSDAGDAGDASAADDAGGGDAGDAGGDAGGDYGAGDFGGGDFGGDFGGGDFGGF